MYYRYEDKSILKKVVTPYKELKDLDIILIRHGESESNALQEDLKKKGELLDNSKKIEDSKIKLTSKGKEQAIQLGKKIKKELEESQINQEDILVLVSPYERARETFEESNKELKLNLEKDNIYVLNDLREQSYGAFHMISKEVKKELYEQIYNECQSIHTSFFKPQFLGESPADVGTRAVNVINFIKEYARNNNAKKVLIYGHGNINRCLLMNILNLPPEIYDDFARGGNASIIRIKNGKYVEEE